MLAIILFQLAAVKCNFLEEYPNSLLKPIADFVEDNYPFNVADEIFEQYLTSGQDVNKISASSQFQFAEDYLYHAFDKQIGTVWSSQGKNVNIIFNSNLTHCSLLSKI